MSPRLIVSVLCGYSEQCESNKGFKMSAGLCTQTSVCGIKRIKQQVSQQVCASDC